MIQGLQFVRANAVLLVVATHAAAVLGLHEYFDQSLLGGVFAKGAVGVDIFFALSGFIIVHVGLKRGRGLAARSNPRAFLLKRFVRIVPFLWVSVAAYAAIRFIGAHEFEWAPYLTAMTLFPVGEVRPNVVWSLRHEALFYVVFAVSFLMRRRAPWILGLWCAAPVLLWIVGMVPSGELLAFVFNRANGMFGVGVVVGLIYQRYGLPIRLIRAPVGWAIICAASVAAFAARDWLGDGVVGLMAMFVVIAGLVTGESKRWFARAWEKVGDASYAIYLTHNIFLLVGATAWVKVFGRNQFPLAVAVLGLVAVAGGLLVHLFVERPVIRAARRLLPGHTAGPVRQVPVVPAAPGHDAKQ